MKDSEVPISIELGEDVPLDVPWVFVGLQVTRPYFVAPGFERVTYAPAELAADETAQNAGGDVMLLER